MFQHVVIGVVIEGMDVVKNIEAHGSASGRTRLKVIIKECGQLNPEVNSIISK